MAEMVRAWERGDAVAPLDLRLARPALRASIEAIDPTVVVEPDGSSRRRGRGAEEGDAAILRTSGSTAAPKAVVLSQAAIRASAAATNARLGLVGSSHTWLACIPLAHVGGFSVVARALAAGSGLVVHDGFDPDRVMEVARERPSFVSLVPAAYRRIDPSVFRGILLGGAAPPGELAPNVTTTYGMTETASGVVYDGVPLEGVEVSFGKGGEILLRGPMLASRYRDDSPVADAEGWLHTGDAGELDGAGRLVVHGRISEVINTGGEKVWPAEVEAVLSTHPAVAQVAIWRRADPEWGERVVAWVVPRGKEDPPDLGELRSLVKSSLAPWAAPKELVVLDELPTTASGKLARSALR